MPESARKMATPFAWFALAAAAVISITIAVHGLAHSAQTWNGLVVAPEHRCSPYDRSAYPYSQSAEPEIVASMGGKIYGPYTGRYFASMRDTDIGAYRRRFRSPRQRAVCCRLRRPESLCVRPAQPHPRSTGH